MVDDKDCGTFGERAFRPCQEVFCAAADLYPHLPGASGAASGNDEHSDRAGITDSSRAIRLPPLVRECQKHSLVSPGTKSTVR